MAETVMPFKKKESSIFKGWKKMKGRKRNNRDRKRITTVQGRKKRLFIKTNG